ncbi:MAG TPA: hypothetical protein VH092_20655 [Urbifossiella sp.]|nr:hypothetical protein [Urbifossiella sp.]
MPVPLLKRLKPHTVGELRAAARQRAVDAEGSATTPTPASARPVRAHNTAAGAVVPGSFYAVCGF